jgi:preprotein translocase subunit SecE
MSLSITTHGGFFIRKEKGIIAYFTTMIFIDYLRDTKAELRHVSWPTKKQTLNYTIIVLLISIGTGIFLGVIDFGFAQVLKRFI